MTNDAFALLGSGFAPNTTLTFVVLNYYLDDDKQYLNSGPCGGLYREDRVTVDANGGFSPRRLDLQGNMIYSFYTSETGSCPRLAPPLLQITVNADYSTDPPIGYPPGTAPRPSPPPAPAPGPNPPPPAPGTGSSPPPALQGPPLTFPPGATPYPVAGAFRQQWETRGGLAINGYPLSEVFLQRLEDGTSYWVQYFERVRIEYHPEVADPRYQVQLGQFGRRLHPLDPPAVMQPGAAYFPETKHNVSGGFLSYWQDHGDLAQFGYPLSEVFKETLEDGNEYEVQYFERARFEYHGNEVLLGQFGRRILAETPR